MTASAPAPSQSPHSWAQSWRENRILLGAIATLLLLSNVPYGAYLLYPFELFSTWIHETCHGLAALAVGGEFGELRLFPDTSGQALSRYPPTRLHQTLVASAGYMGTSLFGALLLLLQRSTRFSRSLAAGAILTLLALALWRVQPWSGVLLYLALIASISVLAFASPPQDVGRFGVFALGSTMLLTLLFARTPFTIAVLLGLGGLLVLLGVRSPPALSHFVFALLAATCGLNAVTSIRHLFSPHQVVNGQTVSRSDAHAVASALFGPPQLWASLWLGLSCLLLGWALWRSLLAPSHNPARDPDTPSTPRHE